MLTENDIEENCDAVVVAAKRSEAATTTATDDRSIPLRSGDAEIVGKPDRRWSFENSPNSRQSQHSVPSSYLQGRDISMMTFESVIGIDVSKNRLDIADWPESFTSQATNDKTGHQQLIKKLITA